MKRLTSYRLLVGLADSQYNQARFEFELHYFETEFFRKTLFHRRLT